MIPKIVHAIWLGDKPFDFTPIEEQWRSVLDDYLIRLWREGDVSNSCCIVGAEVASCFNYSLAHKLYGAASNIARLALLYLCGGIYLDTDVEVLKKFDLKQNGFLGFQRDDTPTDCLNTAVMGCVPLNRTVERLLHKITLDSPFCDQIWASCTLPTEELFLKRGGEGFNVTQSADDFTLYDKSYFHPFRWDEDSEGGRKGVKDSTVTIHHWEASWKC